MSRDGIMVDLLRHGEAAGGARFRGSLDDPLTETGWRQMRAAVAGDGSWDAVIASPARRCADFAADLARERALPIRYDDRLREIHFGAWEGCSPTELLAADPESLARFFDDPVGHPPPGSEPVEAFRERAIRALDDLRGPERRWLVVTHGGVIRALLCHVRRWPPARMAEIAVPHAAVYRLAAERGGPWRERPR